MWLIRTHQYSVMAWTIYNLKVNAPENFKKYFYCQHITVEWYSRCILSNPNKSQSKLWEKIHICSLTHILAYLFELREYNMQHIWLVFHLKFNKNKLNILISHIQNTFYSLYTFNLNKLFHLFNYKLLTL